MLSKIFKIGNSLAVSLPSESIQAIGLQEGSEISLIVDVKQGRIVIEPVPFQLTDVDVDIAFAQQLDAFIVEYRPALKELAR